MVFAGIGCLVLNYLFKLLIVLEETHYYPFVNPVTPVVELTTGKSVESDFTEDMPRSTSAVETAITLIPGGRIEAAAIKITERKLVSLDMNALVRAVEEDGKAQVKGMIGTMKPIVSITNRQCNK